MASSKKFNILCLHGYRQNGDTFKNKIGSFRKILKPYAEFSFIDAPHLAKKILSEDEIGEEFRSWWFNQEDGNFTTEMGTIDTGFDDSLKLVEETWKNGDYDGILAFSQGASFLSAVCGMRMQNLTLINPKFVILACGFHSVSSSHTKFYKAKIDIPSMHIGGATDKVIPHVMHLELEEAFLNPFVYHHEGGHLIPASSKDRNAYRNFFDDLEIKKTE